MYVVVTFQADGEMHEIIWGFSDVVQAQQFADKFNESDDGRAFDLYARVILAYPKQLFDWVV